MKNVHVCIFLLLCLLACVLFPACDQTPPNVVIDKNELIPNEKEDTTLPDGGSDSGEVQDSIGENKPVDLPYLPA